MSVDKIGRKFAESSLSRLYRHMQEHDCGTITAARFENVECPAAGIEGHVFTAQENKARNRSLQTKLNALGYGVTKIDGSYIENFGTPNAREVKEDSFFVVDLSDRGTLRDDLRRLGEEFQQDSIMFIPRGGETSELWGTQPNTCLSEEPFPAYGQVEAFNHRRMGVEGEFMTKIRNRPFLFEQKALSEAGPLFVPQGMSSRMGMAAAAKKHWTEFLKD